MPVAYLQLISERRACAGRSVVSETSPRLFPDLSAISKLANLDPRVPPCARGPNLWQITSSTPFDGSEEWK